MRVALVAETFRSRTPLDVDSHVRSLAPALARAGVRVEVFAGTRGSGVPAYSQRRHTVQDHVASSSGAPPAAFGVTRIELEGADDATRIAESFGAFLDRERPDVCHFEHLHAFGVGLVREARKRRIPTIHSASDTWPAHDRVSLTLPDLSPFELGDAQAEARAVAAEWLLARSQEDAAEPAGPADMQRWLHGDLETPAEVAALRDAQELVEERRAEKRVALSAIDRRFAASRLLSKDLSAAVGRAFTFRAPGVDTALLRGVESVNPSPSSAGFKSLAFIGSSDPTTGVNVLLDALEAIRSKESLADADADAAGGQSAGTTAEQADKAPAGHKAEERVQLTLLLRRTNGARDAALASRAAALGAPCTFEEDAPTHAAGSVLAAIAQAHAVVLPSVWGEVAPALARLALAARRPVIASRMPGVLEAVPQGAGVFVAPADVEAWKEAILAFDPVAGLKSASAARSTRMKSVDDEVVEWVDTYRQLAPAATASASPSGDALGPASGSTPPVGTGEGSSLGGAERRVAVRSVAASGGRAPATSMPHLFGFEAELAAVSRLSLAELFARAQEGLGQLRSAFGVDASDAQLLARVVARGGATRDRAEQDGRIRREVAETLSTLGVARAAMRANEAARSRRVADLQSVLAAYEQEVLARGAAAAQAASELDASLQVRKALEGEAVALRGDAATLREEMAVAEAEAERLRGRAADLEAHAAELDERNKKSEGRTESLASERDEVARQRDELRAQLAEVEAERDRLDSESRSVHERADAVAGQVERATAALAEAEAERAKLESSIAARETEIGRLREGIGRMAAGARTVGGSAEGERSSTDALADLETIEGYCSALERDLGALQSHDTWIRDEATRLVGRLAYAARSGGGAASIGASMGSAADEWTESDRARDQLMGDLARGSSALDALVRELDWRRREMESARTMSDSLRARFLSSPLAVRVRRWEEGPPMPFGAAASEAGSAAAEAETETVTETVTETEPRAPLPGAADGANSGAVSSSRAPGSDARQGASADTQQPS